VHAKGKTLETAVDLHALARRTSGYSGAELATLMNEAAIATATRNASVIGAADLDGALDKLMVGLRRPSHATERVRSIVAVHEAGHACMALLTGYDQVSRVTILPRSNGVGGFTALANAFADDGAGLPTRERLLQQMQMILGGRVAEELAFGKARITVGASGDLRRAQDLALAMVTEYGMVDADLGLTASSHARGSARSAVPDAVSRRVARCVDKLIGDAYAACRRSMRAHWRLVTAMQAELLAKETLSAADVDALYGAYVRGSARAGWLGRATGLRALPQLPALPMLPALAAPVG
jgi:cell division protease FtsH